MSLHTYPSGALAADVVRAGAGLGLTGGPVVGLDLHIAVALTLGACASIFAAFGVLTVLRGRTRIESDGDAVTVLAPYRRRLEWSRLERVALRYYSIRGREAKGWMQLELIGGRARIEVDSRLHGFAELVSRAASAASDNGLRPSPTTIENIRSMGIESGPFGAPGAGLGREPHVE